MQQVVIDPNQQNIVSAMRGFERVEYDGQLIRAHENEMVLPARIAEWVRTASNEGEGGTDGEALEAIREQLTELNARVERANRENVNGLNGVRGATEDQTGEVRRQSKNIERSGRRQAESVRESA